MKCPYCNGEIESGSAKCRHCGEWLDEAARTKAADQKLAEEKGLERERIRERQRQQSRKQWGCCAVILLPVVFLVIPAILSIPPAKRDDPKAQPAGATPAPDAKQAVVAADAPLYCKAHPKTEVVLAADSDALKEGYPVSAGKGFTAAECATIISKLYALDPRKAAMDTVANGQYFIGMDSMLLIYSLGSPDRINATTTALGTSGQWVYGQGSAKPLYAYVDEAGKLSSVQH
jgi:hypothetical protein